MAFGNRLTRSYNISVPTILLHLMTNAVESHMTRLVAPFFNAASQSSSSNLPLVLGGLLLLFVIVLVLIWRVSRRPNVAPPTGSPTSPDASPQMGMPPPPGPVVISLEFTATSGQRLHFVLDKPALTIGRAPDNDIVLSAPIVDADTVSQHHARLRRDQDDYIVRDLSSRNGIAVNGRQTIENLLRDGDRIKFGEAEATFHQSAGGAA